MSVERSALEPILSSQHRALATAFHALSLNLTLKEEM